MHRLLLVLLVALLPTVAFAQSSPNLIFNQIPTAAQWNGYFSSKADALNGTLTTPALVTPTIHGGSLISTDASLATVTSGGQTQALNAWVSSAVGNITSSLFTANGGSSRVLSSWAADRLNVKSFGAVGGAKTAVVNVTIGSGSPTALTVNLATFVSADIGKTIDIPGAGAAGGVLTATILAVGSSTTATLSVAASTFPTAVSSTIVWGFDDGAAIASAIAYVNSATSTIKKPCIYFPADTYFIKTMATHFAQNVPGCLEGDGSLKSFLTVSASFSGDLFSWDEAWGLTPLSTGTYPISSAWNGATVLGLSMSANSASSNSQNALMFYDRNDFAHVEDVGIFYFHGSALNIGTTNIQPQAYMRESKFIGILSWANGTSTVPAVSIGSVGSGLNSDATNELDFVDLHIISSNGKGLVINNSYASNSVRLMKFHTLRVESSVDDNITIGDPSLTGAVSSIYIYGLDVEATASGKIGVHLTAPALGSSPVGIQMSGLIAGNGAGLTIDAGRAVSFQGGISTGQTSLTIGASTLVGNISIDGEGSEYQWTTSIDATSLPNLRLPPLRVGNPGSIVSMLANVHDGAAGRGVAIPLGSNDLSSFRTNSAMTASGAFATIGGGESNRASGGDCTIPGGASNVCANFRSTVGGGFNHVIASQYATISGGMANGLSGNFSAAPGGANAIDRARPGSLIFANNVFSVQGDAQIVATVLRATGTTAMRLLGDTGSASTINCANIPDNTAYNVRISLHARNNATPGTDYDWMLPTGLLTRDTGAASTAWSAGTPVIITRGTTTGAAVAVTADTTNGCINTTFTPPSGNTDVWHAVERVETVEVE